MQSLTSRYEYRKIPSVTVQTNKYKCALFYFETKLREPFFCLNLKYLQYLGAGDPRHILKIAASLDSEHQVSLALVMYADFKHYLA